MYQKFMEELCMLNKGIRAFVVHVAVTVPGRAENGIDPDKERAHCVVGVLKGTFSTDNGSVPEAIHQGTVSLCFWLQSAFFHTSNVIQTWELQVVSVSQRLRISFFLSWPLTIPVCVWLLLVTSSVCWWMTFLWCLTCTLSNHAAVSVNSYYPWQSCTDLALLCCLTHDGLKKG